MAGAAPNQEVKIVFNLREELPGLFVPLAYIVSLDNNGLLAHIQQQATAETIGAFQLSLSAAHQRCFTLVEELQLLAIAENFKGKNRKIPDISQLLDPANQDQSPIVWRYIHRRLDELLSICVSQPFPITLNIERQLLAKDFVLGTSGHSLQPLLSFKKKDGRVHYTLQLLTPTQDRLTISRHHVIPLTNHPAPAWILVDRELHRLEHLNGYLVKPFLQKDEVLIPADRASSYFRQFIAKVVSKVSIEADGFAVDTKTNLLACQLALSLHPMEDRYYLLPKMDYGLASFGWNEKTTGKTLLDLSGEEVKITRIERNQAQENSFLRRLTQVKCSPVEHSQFYLPKVLGDQPEKLAVLQWVIDHRHNLLQAGFQLQPPVVEDKTVALLAAAITTEISTSIDWFDIRGEVVIGQFRIPFVRIAQFIRKKEIFYPLPNGEYFLIPKEWFSRFEEIVQFAVFEQDYLKLAKIHRPLLDEIDPDPPSSADVSAQTSDFIPSQGLKASLRPYQLAGVKWLVQHYHQRLGACLADDMGLGKTLQTITVLLHAKEQKAQQQENHPPKNTAFTPQLDLFAQATVAADAHFLQPLNALIVLPASLIYNWESEIKKFAPSLTVLKHTGQNRQQDTRILQRYDVLLTTYQTALRDQAVLEKIDFTYIVLDESQQIKNRQSKVFKAINALNASHRISLSGTPIENSLSDLWSQMQFLNPGLLGSYTFFKKSFQEPIEKADDEMRKEQLRKLVAPYLLRRTKQQVAGDLPPLHTQHLVCEMSSEQRRRYEEAKSAARNQLLDHFTPKDFNYRNLVLTTLSKLRQLANHPVLILPDYKHSSGKFDEIMEQWEVVRKGGHKALFFSSFVTHLALFKATFKEKGYDFAWLTGDTPLQKRNSEVDRFQNDPSLQAFFISIKSGGTGLNLQAADYVFILDPWWNPKIEDQAIGRAHRIGRKDTVFVQQYISKDTIEEKILLLQQRKSQLAADILSETPSKFDFTKEDLNLLLY